VWQELHYDRYDSPMLTSRRLPLDQAVVFDISNPRKTSNHIVYENTKARWEHMHEDLISIAAGDTGNQLVLQKTRSGLLSPDVYLWNHETNKIKKWSRSLDFIKEKAQKRIENIELQIQRAAKRKARE